MAGVYSDTTNISDTAQADAADVKTPLDALDTQLALLRFAGGRLSLSSTQAVPTADISSAGTLYYHPYAGAAGCGLISLWDSSVSGIKTIDFTGATVSLSMATGFDSLKMYDIFGYLANGLLVLEGLAWTSAVPGSSSRATALTWQNGMLCKDGDPTRRYLGTLYCYAAGLVKDTAAIRAIANAHNQVPRKLLVAETTASWTYATATWRNSRALSTNELSFIAPLDGTHAHATFSQVVGGTSIGANVGLALDSTTPTYSAARDGTGIQTLTIAYDGVHAAGRHYISLCEYVGGGTATFYGGTSNHLAIGYVMG